MGTTMSESRGYMKTHQEYAPAKKILWAVPIGRFLYSLLFIMSGLNHFSSGSISYAESAGVPIPGILVPVTGIMILVGGLTVLLGLHARAGASLLILFLVPVTLIMHDFWNITDPQMAQMQMSHFMKNVSLLGGAILMTFYGAGPYSIDHHRAKKHH